MRKLQLVKKPFEPEWVTTTYCGCDEDGNEIPYLRISFEKGTPTLHKVEQLTTAIKIIIQADPLFQEGCDNP